MMSSTNAGNVRNGHGCYRLMWWYYVLALNLFFGEAYEEVMRQLVNGLRFLGNWRYDWTVPSTSALSQARTRLGEAPLKLLFERIAVPMARAGTRGACGHGLPVIALYAL